MVITLRVKRMRWLVEVSGLGKSDSQKLCVEAESWQRALQAARSQRGEDGPMSGFSIELLEEGYRAVDPMARVRFIVKRAPDDMPVTPKGAAPEKANGSVAPAAPAAPVASAAANGKAPPATSSAEPTERLPPAPASSASAGSKIPRPGASIPPANQTQANTPEAKRRAETMTFGATTDASDKESGPVVERAPTLAIGSPIPGLPTAKLVSQRVQDPSDAQPLTYREYAFALPDGTTEEVAGEVLRAQLRLVEASVAGAKAGKLVNLAAFDVEFTGKPPRAPLATLTWKDWKGEPVLAFPRRGGATPAGSKPPSAAPPASFLANANVVVPQAAAAPSFPAPAPAQAAPAQAAPAQAAPAPAPAPAVQAVQAGPAAPVVQAPSAPPPAPPANIPLPASTRMPSAPAIGEVGAPGMVRTPSGRFVRGRVTGDELITSLFESMHDLHFLRDALDGGQFCLALATEVLPARAALIHFFDIEKREWVVACTRGKDAQKLLTVRTPESDEILREAARKRRALVITDAAARAHAERYQKLGGARSLVVAPIMQAGRALGALEILNPLDGQPFNEDEGNAMTYIAEQFAEYLGSRGIVTDRTRIEAAATAR